MDLQIKTQLVQYAVFFLLILSGVLVITKIQQQDWMTEEINSDYRHFRKTFEKAANRSNFSDGLFSILYRIPDDAAIRIQLLFGVKKACQTFTIHRFKSKYMEFAIPKIEWCVTNDFFINPEKYELPDADLSFAAYKNEGKALNQAFICMVMSLVLVTFSLIMLVLKTFKWKLKLNVTIIISTVIACSFIIAALSIVHTKFNFKRDFEKNREIIKSHHQEFAFIDGDDDVNDAGSGGDDGKTRSDTHETGYFHHYNSNTTSTSNHHSNDKTGKGYSNDYNNNTSTSVPHHSIEHGGEDGGKQSPGYSGHYHHTNHSIFMNHTATYETFEASLERGLYETVLLLMVIHSDYQEYLGTPLKLGKINIGLLLMVILLSLLEIRWIKKSVHGGDVGVKYRRASLTEENV